MNGLQMLRNLSQARSKESAPVEQCDLCAAALAKKHQHLIDPATRELVCSCDACSILFDSGGRTRYRRVPRDVRLLDDQTLTNEAWEKLLVPIQLAFFYRSSHTRRVVALYPSPAGVTESLLELEQWSAVAKADPALAALQEDVEGLLVNRMKENRDHYIVPIDRYFELVGILHTHWRGFTGGDRVWNEIQRFFSALKVEAGG